MITWLHTGFYFIVSGTSIDIFIWPKLNLLLFLREFSIHCVFSKLYDAIQKTVKIVILNFSVASARLQPTAIFNTF